MQTFKTHGHKLFLAATLCVFLAACIQGSATPTTFKSPTLSLSPITPTVQAPPPKTGLSQDQAVPLQTVVATDDGFSITILQVHRDAEEELIRMNPANAFAMRSGEETILIQARVELSRAPANPITLYPFDFDLVDESGAAYPYPLTAIVERALTAEFTQPAAFEGWLAFFIPYGRTRLFLRYTPSSGNYSVRWFALQ